MVFPSLHPQARAMTVVEVNAAARRRGRPRAIACRPHDARHRRRYVADAAMVTVTYDEAACTTESCCLSPSRIRVHAGSGMWSNPFTIVARAPEAEYAAYGPVAKVVVNSFALNPRWLQGRCRGRRSAPPW